MSCRMVCLSVLPHFPSRLPPRAWFWCALILVSACDTNVLARVVTGQVAVANGQGADDPDAEDEDDDVDARETPPPPSLTRCPADPVNAGLGRPLVFGPSGSLRSSGRSCARYGTSPAPAPFHAGASLPLRC